MTVDVTTHASRSAVIDRDRAGKNHGPPAGGPVDWARNRLAATRNHDSAAAAALSRPARGPGGRRAQWPLRARAAASAGPGRAAAGGARHATGSHGFRAKRPARRAPVDGSARAGSGPDNL